jgi:hypothetical protein
VSIRNAPPFETFSAIVNNTSLTAVRKKNNVYNVISTKTAKNLNLVPIKGKQIQVKAMNGQVKWSDQFKSKVNMNALVYNATFLACDRDCDSSNENYLYLGDNFEPTNKLSFSTNNLHNFDEKAFPMMNCRFKLQNLVALGKLMGPKVVRLRNLSTRELKMFSNDKNTAK